jgi:hypothetical protein
VVAAVVPEVDSTAAGSAVRARRAAAGAVPAQQRTSARSCKLDALAWRALVATTCRLDISRPPVLPICCSLLVLLLTILWQQQQQQQQGQGQKLELAA